jgi:hypothetical protein
MKSSSRPTADKLRQSHPLDDRVNGWFFQVREVSAGCYIAEGKDLYGHEVSRQSVDPERALGDCIADAKQIAETTPHI